jgi:cytochrome c1
MTGYLATAATHAGPNRDGWVVIVILVVLAVLWRLAARRGKKKGGS